MNKKNIVTNVNITKVAKFLEESIAWLKEADMGCCHFNLSDDLALYIGWQPGYDPKDRSIITSPSEDGYAIVAGIKVRNDFDCADFEYLDYPVFKDTGDCADVDLSMSPDMTKRDYRHDARWFLESFVGMTNQIEKGILGLWKQLKLIRPQLIA